MTPTADARAALFDVDGTLVDTNYLHVVTWWEAFRQAGHAVSVIEDWKLLEQALQTVPVDLILVDVAEASRVGAAIATAPTHPQALYVASPNAVLPADVICRLKSSDRPVRYLDEVENAMKARARPSKRS